MESSPRQPRDFSLACGTVHLDAEGARPAHGAPHVSAERNDVALVRRIAVSEQPGD
jgi:hypothetical protein